MIIEKYNNFDLIVCDDIGGWKLNAGVILMKNCAWTKQLVNEWKDMNHTPHLQGGDQIQLIRSLESKKHDQNRYTILPRKIMNQHPDEFEDGDFILHMMGKSETERIERFKQYVD